MGNVQLDERQSAALWRSLLAHAPLPWLLLREDASVLDHSAAYESLFGQPPPSQPLEVPCFQRLGIGEAFKRASQGENVELPAQWCEPSELAPLMGGRAKRLALAMTLSRISGTPYVSVILTHTPPADEHFRTFANSIPQLAWIAEPDGSIHWFNERWYEYTGTTPDEMDANGGWGWDRVHDPAHLARVKARFIEAFSKGEPWEDTFPLRRKDGEMRWHLSRAMPVRDSHGRVVRWFGTNTDIEDQRRLQVAAAERSRRARERLHNLVMQAPVAIAIFQGPRCVIDLANARIARIWGRAPEEVLGKPLFEAMPEQAHQGFEALIEEVRKTGKPFIGNELPAKVARLRGGGLEDIYVNIVFEPLRSEDGAADSVMVVASEVTETVRARQSMEVVAAQAQRSEERLAFSLRAGGLGSWQLELGSGRLEVSEGFRQTMGLAPGEAVDLERLRSLLHPPDRERMVAAMRRAIESQTEYASEYQVQTPSGEGRWVAFRGRVSFGPEGAPASLSGVTIDVTAQKQGELERERLVHELAGAVRVRDEFLSVASHELKTPLTPLSLRLAQMRAIVEGGADGFERFKTSLDVAERQVKRLSALVGDLLDVSRLTYGRLSYERAPMDLGALVQEIAHGFEPLAARAGCELRVTAQPGVVGAWDALRLDQVVTNLLSNALKYGQGKPIDLDVRSSGEVAELRVRDHGLGLEPGAEERIFGRFERAVSERNYGGLGLGLWVTRQIVEALGGTVSAANAAGGGAQFTIRLPRSGKLEHAGASAPRDLMLSPSGSR